MNKRTIASLYLRASRWRFETDLPKLKKYVIVAYPHTSNWDGINLVFCAQSVGVNLNWMVKRSLVDGPLGRLLLKFGAVPIDRSQKNNVVDQMVAEFEKRDSMALAIPPEGTRSKREGWKSGFYHIARGANVPVVPGYLDFNRRVAGLGDPITMTGDVAHDMANIEKFYLEKNPIGKHHSLASPIRLLSKKEVESAHVSNASYVAETHTKSRSDELT